MKLTKDEDHVMDVRMNSVNLPAVCDAFSLDIISEAVSLVQLSRKNYQLMYLAASAVHYATFSFDFSDVHCKSKT